jgi:hypothetical protein
MSRDISGKVVQQTLWRANRQGKLLVWKREDGEGRLLENSYLTPDGKPRVWKEGYHRWVSRVDARGNKIEWWALGLKDQPVMTTWGFHRWRARYDNKGRLLEKAFFDTQGNLTPHSDGHARVVSRFDERGNPIETVFLGQNDRPINGKDGWSRRADKWSASGDLVRRSWWRWNAKERKQRLWKREDAKGHILESVELNLKGEPRPFKEGHYRWKARYDRWGNRIEWSAFGPDKEPVATRRAGYHRWVCRYNDKGKLLEKAHFGIDGKPAFRADEGSFRFVNRYDERGNRIEVLFLGPNGRPMNIKAGYAKREDTWTKEGKLKKSTFWKATPEGELEFWKSEDFAGKVVEGEAQVDKRK